MSHPQSLNLTPSRLQALDHAIAHSDCLRTRRRAEAIRLLHEGQTPQAVAGVVGVSVRSLRAWLKRYQQAGLDGLADRPRSGRPRKADSEYVDLLEAILVETPHDMGFDDEAGWTVKLLCDYMERETGITLSSGRMRKLLHRLGYRFKAVPSLLTQMLDPFPIHGDYADMRAWMEMEKMLRAQLPEYQCRPIRTWVKVTEEDAMT